MTPTTEIELKLELEPAHHAALAQATLLLAAPGETRHLVATYFDTPDQAVRNHGFALRVRRKGQDHIQTVKAADGPSAGFYARSEWERPVPGNAPVLDTGSGPLLAAISAEAVAQLVPVFTVEVERTIRQLSVEGAEIEFALDSGVIRAGDAALALCEVELELRDGPAHVLFELARRLDRQAPLRLGVRAKSERGYALAAGAREGAAKAEPIPLDPEMKAADAFRAIAQACIRHYRLNESILLVSDNVEAIHQARVALRRLRTAFALFKPLLDGDADAARLKAGVQSLAVKLGAVRDLDALIERMGPGADPRVASARRERFEEARAELEAVRTRLLMLDLAEWLSGGAWQDKPIETFTVAVLDRTRKRLRKAGHGLAHLDADELHRVRIRAKKARYATEFFAALWPPKGRKAWLDLLETLQDRLGTLNDIATGQRLLAELGLPVEVAGVDQPALRARIAKAWSRIEAAAPYWRS